MSATKAISRREKPARRSERAKPAEPRRDLPALASEIHQEVRAAEASWRDAVGHAIRAGELLIEAKAQLAHGSWSPWLRKNFPGAERTARNYMRLASNRQRVADLPTVREAIAELTEPKPEPVVPVKTEKQAGVLAHASQAMQEAVYAEALDRAGGEADKVNANLLENARGRVEKKLKWEKPAPARGPGAPYTMRFSPAGNWKSGIPKVPVNIPRAIEASERARAASDEIRLVLGPWTADGELPERRRVPESNTVKAWREKPNGNGAAPRDLKKIIADIKKLRASLPADSPDHAALAKALEVLSEIA